MSAARGISAGAYVDAGQSAWDNSIGTIKAARRNSPKMGEIAIEGIKQRAATNATGLKAAADVANAGIRAEANVRKAKIEADRDKSLAKSKATVRKAGKIAAAGTLIGEGIMDGHKAKDLKAWYQRQEQRDIEAQAELAEFRRQQAEGRAKWQEELDKFKPTEDASEKPESPPKPNGDVATTPSPSQSPLPSSQGVMTKAQIKQLAIDSGFSTNEAPTVVGISGGESGFDPTNSTKRSGLFAKTGEDSVGLMQINWGYHKDRGWLQQLGITKREDLFDPVKNMKAAKFLYDQRNTFEDWSVYNDGSYQKYL